MVIRNDSLPGEDWRVGRGIEIETERGGEGPENQLKGVGGLLRRLKAMKDSEVDPCCDNLIYVETGISVVVLLNLRSLPIIRTLMNITSTKWQHKFIVAPVPPGLNAPPLIHLLEKKTNCQTGSLSASIHASYLIWVTRFRFQFHHHAFASYNTLQYSSASSVGNIKKFKKKAATRGISLIVGE